MRRLLSAAAVAIAMATSLAAQQQLPPANPQSRSAVNAILMLGERILRERLYSPREVWPGLEPLNDPRSASPFHTDVARLISAANSSDPSVREAFLIVFGTVGVPKDLARFVIPALGDVSIRVRQTAPGAIAMVLRDRKAPGVDDATALATRALIERVPLEPDGLVAGHMLSVLGEIATAATSKDAERMLRQETLLKVPTPKDFEHRQFGALQGFEAMTRHLTGISLDDATRVILRKLAVPGLGFDLETGPVLSALEALVNARDNNLATIRAAAQFRCSQSQRTSGSEEARRSDCGWEFRRLAFQLMDDARRDYMGALSTGLADPSFRVRIEALRVFAREIPKTLTCAPLFQGLTDTEPFVAIEAIRLMDAKCDLERDDIAQRLRGLAVDLGDDEKATRWHVPAAAMESLVKFAPAEADKIANEIALLHKVWYVRASAARVAGAVGDETLAMQLAGDDEPNVRTEAVYALIRMHSPKVATVALAALDSNDYQLVLTGAAALATSGDPVEALPVVMKALKRITAIGDDTSREARLALLARVQQAKVADKDVLELLAKLLEDYDPVVGWASADVIETLTGTPALAKPSRGDLQPTGAGSGCYQINLQNGESFEADLNNQIGALADRHFYDGLTFHRAIPDAFVEGGSPAANYYTGADKRTELSLGPEKFVLDNVAASFHTRGTIALSRHELHTGSTQFFIELVDSPHLRREFTVVGHVTRCLPSDPSPDVMMDIVDHLMEGAKIASVVLRIR